VFVLERLSDDEILRILTRAVERVSKNHPSSVSEPSEEPKSSQTVVETSEEKADGKEQKDTNSYREISPAVYKCMVNLSMGDARTGLSLLELVLTSPTKTSDSAIISNLRRSVSSRYDRSGEDRYNMISALHKSIRGSDGGAALYWLAR
jgi:putative ATPase